YNIKKTTAGDFMIKVGLLNDSFPPMIDGVAQTVFNYATILDRDYDNIEPTVIIPKYPDMEENFGLDVYRYPSLPQIGKMPYRIGNPFLPTNIQDVKKKKLDIMHIHCPFASSAFARQVNLRYRKPNKIPTVFTYHTKFDIDIDRYIELPNFNKICKTYLVDAVASCDEVWAVSDGAGKNLQSLGYKGDYIIMPNGTDFKKGMASEENVEEIKRIYKLDKQLVFLFVGRMMWYKNLKIILDTMKILSDQNIDFKCFFIGEGADRSSAEKYAQELHIEDKTVFTGAIYDREKIRTFYSMADLFMFPSTYDTNGLVVIEASACECPAIVVKGSCASESVHDGKDGLYCEENAESCAKTILAALKQDGFLKNLGKTAAQTVYFSWEDAVKKATQRYETVLENHRKNLDK
ncbi:MAG: glycosyltransferase, partial [Oscillospiraceae bacterium]|nr:glycosyltransferase [Candidatus Equicaccousia limihippi]